MFFISERENHYYIVSKKDRHAVKIYMILVKIFIHLTSFFPHDQVMICRLITGLLLYNQKQFIQTVSFFQQIRLC